MSTELERLAKLVAKALNNVAPKTNLYTLGHPQDLQRALDELQSFQEKLPLTREEQGYDSQDPCGVCLHEAVRVTDKPCAECFFDGNDPNWAPKEDT